MLAGAVGDVEGRLSSKNQLQNKDLRLTFHQCIKSSHNIQVPYPNIQMAYTDIKMS